MKWPNPLTAEICTYYALHIQKIDQKYSTPNHYYKCKFELPVTFETVTNVTLISKVLMTIMNDC